ncbi:MAG: hypothetical protein IRY99_08145 [Isosphaeraceae bacterium]|nr:hypothetical protein [Isosphaeraceae bacterium]
MRRVAAWLCLFIALAGPLVSQAKIAYGIALAVSEIGRNVLESSQEVADEDYDGHDLVTIMAHADAGLDDLQALSLPFDLLALVPLPIIFPSDSHAVERWHGQWKWPPPTAQQRCTLLQVFLI